MRSAVARNGVGPAGQVAGLVRRKKIRLVPAWMILAGLAASTIYPILFVAFAAFKTRPAYARDPVLPPSQPTLSNLVQAWTGAQVGTFVVNSVIVVSASVALVLVIACLAGFAFAHIRFPFRTVGLVGVLGLMLLPPSVLMVPLFRTVQQVGLLDSYLGLILVYAGLNTPFSIYMMSSYFRNVPSELFEAARVDGASTFRVFRSIALPLARPAVLTLITLNFLWLWNELLFSLLILQSESKRTLMVGLALLQGEHTSSVPLLAAGMLISLVPVLLVFAFFQRNLAEGLTAGALK